MFPAYLSIINLLLVSNTLVFPATDGEWTAPGVEVTEIASIDLLAYGTPPAGEGSEVTVVACQPFLMEEDGKVRWRVNILYHDRLVVVEEGIEPIEIHVGFQNCESAVFSNNGNYAMVGAEVGTEDDPLCIFSLVNLEDRSVSRLHRTFTYGREPVFWVDNDGSSAFLAHGRLLERGDWLRGQYDLSNDTLFMLDRNLSEECFIMFPCILPEIVRSENGEVTLAYYDNTIGRFDEAGSRIWSFHEPVNTDDLPPSLFRIRMNENTETFFLRYPDALYAYETESGDQIMSYTVYSENTSLALSTTSSLWSGIFKSRGSERIFPPNNTAHLVVSDIYGEEVFSADASCQNGRIGQRFGPTFYTHSDGSVILLRRSDSNPQYNFLCLVNGNAMFWQSEHIENVIGFPGNFSPEWWLDYYPVAFQHISNNSIMLAFPNSSFMSINQIRWNN